MLVFGSDPPREPPRRAPTQRDIIPIPVKPGYSKLENTDNDYYKRFARLVMNRNRTEDEEWEYQSVMQNRSGYVDRVFLHAVEMEIKRIIDATQMYEAYMKSS